MSGYWVYLQDHVRGISNGLHRVEAEQVPGKGGQFWRLKFSHKTRSRKIHVRIWNDIPKVLDTGQSLGDITNVLFPLKGGPVCNLDSGGPDRSAVDTPRRRTSRRVRRGQV